MKKLETCSNPSHRLVYLSHVGEWRCSHCYLLRYWQPVSILPEDERKRLPNRVQQVPKIHTQANRSLRAKARKK